MFLTRGFLRRQVLVDDALRTHVSGHAPLTAWLNLERLTYVAAEHDEVNAQLVALPSSWGRSRGVFCVVHFIS